MTDNQTTIPRIRRSFTIGKAEVAMLSKAEKEELKDRISKTIIHINGL